MLTTTSSLGGANVTLRGDDGIALGADVTATGSLSLTSQDAAIVQTGGALSVGGNTDVGAGTGNGTLANAGHEFAGAEGNSNEEGREGKEWVRKWYCRGGAD